MRSSKTFISVLFAFFLAALAPVAEAQILGGSNIINNGDVVTLSNMLGQGPLTLTNIFSHVNGGDTLNTPDFHAAVDGKGPTFSIAKVIAFNGGTANGGSALIPNQIIGGYDPLSWDTSGLHISNTDAERTAFVFNLSTGLKQAQNTTAQLRGGVDFGQFQTANRLDSGPFFGNSGDFYVGTTLNIGHTQHVTYGGNNVTPDLLNNLTGPGLSDNLIYSNFEVFTIRPAAGGGPSVPEPGSLAFLVGLATTGAGLVVLRGKTARKDS